MNVKECEGADHNQTFSAANAQAAPPIVVLRPPTHQGAVSAGLSAGRSVAAAQGGRQGPQSWAATGTQAGGGGGRAAAAASDSPMVAAVPSSSCHSRSSASLASSPRMPFAVGMDRQMLGSVGERSVPEGAHAMAMAMAAIPPERHDPRHRRRRGKPLFARTLPRTRPCRGRSRRS